MGKNISLELMREVAARDTRFGVFFITVIMFGGR